MSGGRNGRLNMDFADNVRQMGQELQTAEQIVRDIRSGIESMILDNPGESIALGWLKVNFQDIKRGYMTRR